MYALKTIFCPQSTKAVHASLDLVAVLQVKQREEVLVDCVSSGMRENWIDFSKPPMYLSREDLNGEEDRERAAGIGMEAFTWPRSEGKSFRVICREVRRYAAILFLWMGHIIFLVHWPVPLNGYLLFKCWSIHLWGFVHCATANRRCQSPFSANYAGGRFLLNGRVKSQQVCFRNRPKTVPNDCFITTHSSNSASCSCARIFCVESVKYLGAHFDGDLSWNTHMTHICKKLRLLLVCCTT